MRKEILFYFILFTVCLLAYQVLAWWMPETYRAMQLDSFFLFTADYFHSKFSLPPALTSWCASLLLQVFRWPWLGALVQGLVSGLTAASLSLLFRTRGWKVVLALLPSIALFLFWPFSLQLQLQVLVLSATLLLYSRLPHWWMRLALALLLLPLGFLLLNMPLLAVLFVLLGVAEWVLSRSRIHVLVIVVVLLCSLLLPGIYSQHVAFIPSQKRYTHVTELRTKPLWDKTVRQNDAYYRILRAAEEERWPDMRRTIWESGLARTKLMQAYLLLAESAEGTLADNLFSYPINDAEDFFFRHERNPYSCQFNRLFYHNLGLWDECFHQAQEYFLLQDDACCFRSLTQMVDYSIREGEYAVAEKYLTILRHAPFYGNFVQEQRSRIAKQKTAKPVERPLRADNFVGGYPFVSEMVRLLDYTDGGQSLRILDYLLCGLLLQKKLQYFDIVFRERPLRKGKPLPTAYQQAFRLLQTKGQVPEEECVWGTYYYFYRNTAIPAPNERMRQSAIN